MPQKSREILNFHFVKSLIFGLSVSKHSSDNTVRQCRQVLRLNNSVNRLRKYSYFRAELYEFVSLYFSMFNVDLDYCFCTRLIGIPIISSHLSSVVCPSGQGACPFHSTYTKPDIKKLDSRNLDTLYHPSSTDFSRWPSFTWWNSEVTLTSVFLCKEYLRPTKHFPGCPERNRISRLFFRIPMVIR